MILPGTPSEILPGNSAETPPGNSSLVLQVVPSVIPLGVPAEIFTRKTSSMKYFRNFGKK